MSRRRREFGVVVTVPEELSRAANRIRRRYDPNFPRIGPHVTVLPPRPLPLTRREVLAAVRRAARATRSFDISLGAIRSFAPVMPVVYASLRRGQVELGRLHARLARGALRGKESFPYVPHLTLGQKLEGRRHSLALELSRRIFAATRNKQWTAGMLVVVERLTEERWLPLPPIALNGAPGAAPRRGLRRSGGPRRRKT